MAKLTYSPLITQISGRLGGGVFSRWQGVQLIRRFVAPSQPRTTPQVNHRNGFRNALRLFASLPGVNMSNSGITYTDAWRGAWRERARREPGQARNFFVGELLMGDAPSIYGRDWFSGAANIAKPVLAVDTATSKAVGVTVSNNGTPPAGYKILGVIAAMIKEGQDLTTSGYTITDVLAMTGADKTKLNFTALQTGDKFEIHGVAVFVPTDASGEAGMARFSAEAVQTATVG